ncbi:MAG: hypothetical protein R3F60_20110 [bacterium]
MGWLRGRGKGHAVLLRQDARPADLATVPTAPGVVGRLADLVPADDALVRTLLGGTLVVEDVAAALAVAPAWPGLVVTRDGVRVQGSLEVRGGADGADTAPLSRRRELRGLAKTVEAAEADRLAAQASHQAAEAEVRVRQAAAEEAGRARHRAELARAEARKDRHRIDAEAQRLTERATALEAAVERLATQAAEATARAEAAEAAVRAVEASHVDRHGALGEMAGRVVAGEQARDAAVATLHAARAERQARQARREAAAGHVQRVARQIKELEEGRERHAKARLLADTRQRTLADARKDEESSLEAARKLAARRATAAGDAREAWQAAEAALTTAAAEVEGCRKARDAAREASTESRLAVQARRLRMEHLAEQLHERFKLTAPAAVSLFADQPPPTGDELERQAQLEALIERMGPVNPNAIQECAEVEERATFLQGQRDDLEAALADLTAAIERIDRTSRRLFKETFEAVNEKFQALFPRLFRGGEARLELTDPNDLLGTGIDMLVSPPGKKVQNVGLLSGGEKAMCAIALVFAVFQVKPSPFCVLDEVDAPLDDANIGRFNEVVREMSRQSQIVLITHNKRTMEIADVLYGVTMEEAGISKLVGVRMQ